MIRGLCINATIRPWVIISESSNGPVPVQALTIDISSALQNGEFDDEIAGKILQEAYKAWKSKISPTTKNDINPSKNTGKYPSCIAIKIGGEIKFVYWIDRDIDSARKRHKGKNATLLEEVLVPNSESDICVPGVSAVKRSEVVKNKIALVTGGAQGFGEIIARGLVASGAIVFIADINLEGAVALAEKLNTALGKTAALAVEVDVSNEESVKKLFITIAETTGGLDICVSNAGVLRAGGILEQTLESFQFVTEINYTGFFLVSKYCGWLLQRQYRTAPGWKTDIIQINSKSGLEGSNKNAAYSGSKFGGIGLTESFAMELVNYNIKVNAVCPCNFFEGPLWTDPENGLIVQYLKSGKIPGARTMDDVKTYYATKVPMKRGCTGIDVMRAIYYIIEQEFETGQSVPVTGGQVMLH
jgi:sorbitol-6-phosphate 2-dehydrogenase